MAPRLWCAVSGHGFGHFAQVAPVLGLLKQAHPDLELHLTGGPPTALLQHHLPWSFSHDPRNRDVGLVQQGALTVDLAATRLQLRALHSQWAHRLQEEIVAMAHWRPHLVLGNIPYLPLMAADHLAIPTVAIASLTWDKVIGAYFNPPDEEVASWLEEMGSAYHHTQLALLPAPALPRPPFAQAVEIPAITSRGENRRDQLRRELGVGLADDRPLVLVSFGGIATRFPAMEALAAEKDILWLCNLPDLPEADNVFAMSRLSHWPHADVAASVDAMVSKPGYGMVVEAAAHGIPFLYLRRHTFPDEDVLCPWIHRHGRAMELDAATFWRGRWLTPLRHLWSLPAPTPPPTHGAEVAMAHISVLLESMF